MYIKYYIEGIQNSDRSIGILVDHDLFPYYVKKSTQTLPSLTELIR